MEFLGIGVLELFFIVLIALIVLGPKDMVKAGRMMGQLLRKLMLSPGLMEAQRWVRNLPAQLMREAGIDEIQNELRKEAARIKEETTVNLEPDLESVPNTIAKPDSANLSPTYPPPLTNIKPNQASSGKKVETQAGAAAEVNPVSRVVQTPEEPGDLPSEWIGAPHPPAGKVKVENRDDFPLEWISPPSAASDLARVPNPHGPTNTGEHKANQD